MSARLHRQLFVAFGVAILLTGATFAVVTALLGDRGHWWHQEVRRIERFAAGRYAASWDDPEERDELTRAIARDLDVGVRVRDARGHALAEAAMDPRCHFSHEVEVRRGASTLGRVEICLDAHRQGRGAWTGPFALVAAIAVLWLLAGLASRRLVRPLRALTRVAREIGEGKLSSRMRLRHGYRGEIGELTTAINDMAARIERQMRAQRDLLATVSHELRGPLARIRVLLEIARDRSAPPELVDEVEKEIVAMDALVGDLLAGSRLDFGALSPRPIDVAELARREWDRAAAPEGTLDVPEDPGEIVADPALVAFALHAVLDNARHHGGGRIALRVRASGDRVAFDVDDEGAGFAPGDEERVFEPFYRAPSAGNGGDGSGSRGVGLGLALVRRIAEAHGGRAAAQNLPGGGARVTLELPREPKGSVGKARA